MQTKKQPSEECFGYYFHLPEPGMELGSPQLDINLHEDPTGQHFDPETLRVKVTDQYNKIEHLQIYHPWPFRKRLQVILGDVVMRDRKDKVVGAFTFGGTLEIEQAEDCTQCRLKSPVPIIDLRDEKLEVQMLAEETKALVARRRADYEPDVEDFDNKLLSADVTELYFGILKSLAEEFQSLPKSEQANAQPFLMLLHHQFENASKLIDPANIPSGIEAVV
jgi:hypothetical protein